MHFSVYGFIPHVLHTDPFFGLGLNTFSVYYEFVTGKSNWGPHSYYVALIVETGRRRRGAVRASSWSGCSGASARRARSAARSPPRATRSPRACGRSRGAAPPRSPARSPSNAFYLTMQFYYFYVFMALALAIPVVFARRE